MRLAGRNVLPGIYDRPFRRPDEATNNIEEGRLAGTVRADNAEDAAFVHVEIDVTQGMEAAEAYAERLGLKDLRAR